MARVETDRLACGICGRSADGDAGHLVEDCPNEGRFAELQRKHDEAEKHPTLMPEPAPGLVFASRCHGAELDAALADGVLTGHCSECNAPVSRQNPRTGKREWLNGAHPSFYGDALPPFVEPDSFGVYVLDAARFDKSNPPTNVRSERVIVWAAVLEDADRLVCIRSLRMPATGREVDPGEWLVAERNELYEAVRAADLIWKAKGSATVPGRVA